MEKYPYSRTIPRQFVARRDGAVVTSTVIVVQRFVLGDPDFNDLQTFWFVRSHDASFIVVSGAICPLSVFRFFGPLSLHPWT